MKLVEASACSGIEEEEERDEEEGEGENSREGGIRIRRELTGRVWIISLLWTEGSNSKLTPGMILIWPVTGIGVVSSVWSSGMAVGIVFKGS